VKTSQLKHLSDSELLEQFYSDNNLQWLGALLERYTLLLFGVCMKYLKDEHEAKDAVQQIFLKVLTDASKYRIEFFKSWLYMVAKNYCLMKLRDKLKNEVQDLNENLQAEEIDQAELMKNERAYHLLEASINDLVPEQQQCIILFYIRKNSYREISEATGFDLMKVKSYIQNGKRNLKLILEKKLNEMNSKK
jgi:RNA polymerase sigma factor (sigma-70 family)